MTHWKLTDFVLLVFLAGAVIVYIGGFFVRWARTTLNMHRARNDAIVKAKKMTQWVMVPINGTKKREEK